MISLDLTKTSEVRIAGDQPNSSTLFILRKNQFMYTNNLLDQSPIFLTSNNFLRSKEIIRTKWSIYVAFGHFALMI